LRLSRIVDCIADACRHDLSVSSFSLASPPLEFEILLFQHELGSHVVYPDGLAKVRRTEDHDGWRPEAVGEDLSAAQ
jgi:hypothetical protein